MAITVPSEKGALDGSFKLLEKICDARIALDVFNYNTLMNAPFKEQAVDKATDLFEEMISVGVF